ncbi:hypothetical protein QR680_008879 [Steinernema hermaphroditum]|uniref:Serine/threonine-protein phosphatase n=1 Tax=Steinernema hermaphroditum TaxID=289476 RepID=A0AA39M7U9_9BILA|nr:hypothetical protein QR680_008879 [Steinernema hermaphroditum]
MSGQQYDIRTFLSKHRDYKSSVTYELEELKWLIGRVRMVMADEKALIEVRHPVNIVGDIHGQYQDLHRIFNACGMPANRTRYLFLGDYVDRGPQSLEVICCLLGLKIAFPNKIFLLRGNHEQEFINKEYGFWAELEKRFPYGLALGIFKEFNDLFGYLPLAALVSEKILCMHGGLSPHLNSLDDLRNIELPQFVVGDQSLVQDLLWADPALDSQGFAPNKLREVSVIFGEDIVYKTCHKLKLDLIVRGHQVMRNGYGFFANRKLVTIFSAPMYDTTLKNRAAVLVVARDKTMRFYLLNPLEKKEDAYGVGFRKNFVDDQSGAGVSKSPSMEDRVRSKIEFAINVGATVASCCALVPFFRKQGGFVATLLLFVSTCAFYSILASVESLIRILVLRGLIRPYLLETTFLEGQWFFIFTTSSMNFIYVSGAILALDRLLLMVFPLQFTRWRISARLCTVALTACVLSFCYLLVTHLTCPWVQQKNGFSTREALRTIGIVYDVVVPVELLLHFLFCVKYYRFMRSQGNAQIKRGHNLRVNQVTLVQSICTTVLCVVPKVLNRINSSFYAYRVYWILVITIYYQLIFSVSVFTIISLLSWRMASAMSPMELKLRPYFEVSLNAICAAISVTAFLSYLAHRKHTNFIGNLLVFIASCAFYSIFHAVDSVARIAAIHTDMDWFLDKSTYPIAQWFTIFKVLSTNFTYVGGIALALDRFCVMSFPLKYSTSNVSAKICVAAGLLCGATAIVSIMTNLMFEYDGDRRPSTTLVLKAIGNVYNVVVLFEFVLHVLFCAKYRDFMSRRRSRHVKQHILKANHITLFQVATQTLFCLVPKILHKINELFFSSKISWINKIAIYYSFYLTIHVFLSCAFILFTLRRRSKKKNATISVITNSLSATQRRTSS